MPGSRRRCCSIGGSPGWRRGRCGRCGIGCGPICRPAADLFAACLLAGSSPVEAAEAVAHAVGGPLAARLRPIVASLRLGGDPSRCWLGLADDPVLAPLGRTLARAATGGAPAAGAVARMADEQRAERRRAATSAARRVGVRATVPLGLCFLPAFLLVGVVPIVIGLTTTLLRPF
ncbi:type II secretion system F family protein [Embleya sp. NBC_00896]|uniref:type II secretion system F family protein n=1 Tax=Embleya sp. NBC_00896 TaxID=2975961 RepID=UPI0038683426|nr:type II secretion system F family protein [Embleya sp. NBC_00896]